MLEGSRKNVGHYNEYTLFRKMLEAYPWYTIMGILPLERIAELMTDKVLYSWRLSTFPPEWLEEKPWLKELVKTDEIREKLKIISDDFLFARDNSLGKGKIPIIEAQLLTNVQ